MSEKQPEVIGKLIQERDEIQRRIDAAREQEETTKPDTEALLEDALKRMNGHHTNRWTVKRCHVSHSVWWEATDDDGTLFRRANLEELISVAQQLDRHIAIPEPRK